MKLILGIIFLLLAVSVQAAYDDIVVGNPASSKIFEVALRDSSTGQMKTGVGFASVAYTFTREGDNANRGSGTCVTMTLDTYADHGWVETSTAGLYQFGIPQAALAAGKNAVTITLKASGVIDVSKRILIMGSDLRATALATNVTQWSGTNVASPATNGYPVVTLKVGTGTGEINASNGQVPSSNERGTDSAMLAGSYVAPDNASITAIKNKTDPLPAQPAAIGSAMTLTAAYDAAKTAAQAGDSMFSSNERGTDGALLADSYTVPLDAAGTRLALGLATANLDMQLAAPLLLLGTPQSQLGTIAGDIAGVKNVAEEASVAAANAETASELLTARNIRLEMDTSSTQFIAIRNKVDNIPAQPAAIGSAMTLTAAYDASKTAAQASDVLAIKVVTDLLYTLLEEADGVWRFTANTLSQGPSGLVLGGDATLANQQKMIEILESGR